MEEEPTQITKYQRYYALHREQKLSKYHTRPDVIAKQEQREAIVAERKKQKEEEKAIKQAEL